MLRKPGSEYFQNYLNENGTRNYFYGNSYPYCYERDGNGQQTGDVLALGGYKDDELYKNEFIAFSPNGDNMKEEMGYKANLLRNARSLKVSILDSEDKEVKALMDEEYLKKTLVKKGENGYSLDSELLPVWDGKDKDGKLVADGQYYYKISATIDYPGATAQDTLIPLKVDTVKPVLQDVSLNKETMKLTGKATDASYISYIKVTGSTGVKSIIKYLDPPSNTYDIDFDLKDFTNSSITLVAGDVAGNEQTQIIVNETPIISANLSSTEIVYTEGETADPLTVTASVYDGGTLSYQWYSNISNTVIGGTPVGTDSNVYTPDISTFETLYYYVEITNTISDNGDVMTAKATSAVAKITVNPNPIHEISLDATGTSTFAAATEGYSDQAAKTVTITNTGNRNTGELSLGLSGANSDAFILSPLSIPNIATGSNTTFTVAPALGLEAGTYNASVSVTSAVYSDIDESFDVSFLVNPAPIYAISLDTAGVSTFATATEGYGAQTGKIITITNTRNRDTGVISLGLSGANSDAFILSPLSIPNIATNSNTTFTVAPALGLEAGTYNASVSVTSAVYSDIDESFDVSFLVNPAPIYSISLDTTGTSTFAAATEGYGAQAAKTVTITNTGNQDTGVISLGFSGANSDAFVLSTPNIPNIATSSNTTFTVAPALGLGAGTYNASVSVTSAVYSDIDESFDVSFSVNTLTPSKQNQIITWNQSNFTATVGDSSITLNASASSGLTVSYNSDNESVATVSGNTLTIAGAGTATITASQQGDSEHNAAANVTRTITVNPRGSNNDDNDDDDDDEEKSDNKNTQDTPDSTTVEIGRTTIMPNNGQATVLNADGSQTLPDGGVINITPTTEDGTNDAPIITFNAPPGTTIGEDGSVHIPETASATITIMTASPEGSGDISPVTITVPGGSYISEDGIITIGSSNAQLTLPDSATGISLPQGTTINADGTITVSDNGSASVSLTGGCYLSITENSVIILDETAPLGYYVLFDNQFNDVDDIDWFYGNMEFVNTGGLFFGTDDTTFSPDIPMTRYMFVTVLYRLAGNPDTSELPQNFTDVAADAYYANAVKWAAANGITNGTSADRFSPEDSITREQAVTFFYNFAKAMGVISDEQDDSPAFEDMDTVSPWALDALRYCADAGIILGKPGNLFDPKAKASRAEVAAMFERFVLLLAGRKS